MHAPLAHTLKPISLIGREGQVVPVVMDDKCNIYTVRLGATLCAACLTLSETQRISLNLFEGPECDPNPNPIMSGYNLDFTERQIYY